jgi:hypothetical protein
MSDGDRQAAGLTKLDLMFVFCEGYAHLRCFRRWPSARFLSPKTPERASLLHDDLAEDIFSCVFSS